MVFTRQKSKTGANPESPTRTRPVTNIRILRPPSQTVFTREHNELFIQPVVQYYQEAEGDELIYPVLGLNESTTEYDMKKYIVLWLANFTLIKIVIHNFLM